MQHYENTLSCSFCDRSQHRVRKLIRAPGAAAICDECVEVSAAILHVDSIGAPARPARPPRLPDDMASILEAIRRYRCN